MIVEKEDEKLEILEVGEKRGNGARDVGPADEEVAEGLEIGDGRWDLADDDRDLVEAKELEVGKATEGVGNAPFGSGGHPLIPVQSYATASTCFVLN